MTYYVQIYKSTDLNSPPISGQVGSALAVLNACLVDGYSGSVTITSLTRSGSTATATVSAADGLKLKTGQILTIAGVTGPGGGDPALYNGTFTITVASATTFTYVMSGTPSGSATTGSTITGSLKLPITSITRGGAGNLTATLTMSNANNTLVTGSWVTIEGCTSTGAAQFNGTFQIVVTSVTTFTYQMASDPGANATVSGGAFYYKAGLQWTRPFAAGTNSQVYISQATLGANGESYSPKYLQVIDNGATAGAAKEAQIYGAEVMQSDQTGILGQFPTTVQQTSGLCFRKSSAASTAVRDWTLWGDEKTFSISVNTVDSYATFNGMCFGYFISTKSGDLYNTLIGGAKGFNTTSAITNGAFSMGWLCSGTAASALYICRSYTQIGSSISSCFSGTATAAGTATTSAVIGGQGQFMITAPNYPDNGYYVQPLFIQDAASGVLRGRWPGTFGSLQSTIINNYDTITNIVGLSGVTLTGINIASFNTTGLALVDTFGPWT